VSSVPQVATKISNVGVNSPTASSTCMKMHIPCGPSQATGCHTMASALRPAHNLDLLKYINTGWICEGGCGTVAYAAVQEILFRCYMPTATMLLLSKFQWWSLVIVAIPSSTGFSCTFFMIIWLLHLDTCC